MVATGNIREDLSAIEEILRGLGGPLFRSVDCWWGTPAPEESIEVLAEEFGELPEDVIDFYRTTDIATFGYFDSIMDPTFVVERREHLSAAFSLEMQRDYPEPFKKNAPKSNVILPMSGMPDLACLIEVGGSDHGRVISPPHTGENYWETLAWSLGCLLYTSPSPRDQRGSRMPSSA